MVGAAIFAVLLPLHAIDNLFNAMLNPLFVLGLGGLSSVAAAAADPRALFLAQAPVAAAAPPRPATGPRHVRPAHSADPFTDGLDPQPVPDTADTRSLDEELGIS